MTVLDDDVAILFNDNVNEVIFGGMVVWDLNKIVGSAVREVICDVAIL